MARESGFEELEAFDEEGRRERADIADRGVILFNGVHVEQVQAARRPTSFA